MKEFMRFSLEAATRDGEEGFKVLVQFDEDFKKMDIQQQANLLVGAHNSLTAEVTRKVIAAVAAEELMSGAESEEKEEVNV